jgi:hypothetical protein
MFFLFSVDLFSTLKNNFESYFCYSKQLSKNKSIEIELTKYGTMLLSIEIDARFRGHDHAGLHIGITILGFNFSFRIYDHRHWNYKLGCWEQ